MKTKIKKIIMMAAVLIFAGAGVSFAHDANLGHHKRRGYDHGYYKKGYGDHQGWHSKHDKPRGQTYRHYKKWHGHQYRWHKKYHKRWHRHPNRYRCRKVHRVHHHYHHYYDRHAPHRHDRTYIGFKIKEPGFKFAVVAKDH